MDSEAADKVLPELLLYLNRHMWQLCNPECFLEEEEEEEGRSGQLLQLQQAAS